MRLLLIGFLLFVSISAGPHAQSPPPAAFEVASVKVNRSGNPVRLIPRLQPGGRVYAVNAPLRDLIRLAYGLNDNQLVIDGSLADAGFDLEARAGAAATADEAR